jgi:hypothetical protein
MRAISRRVTSGEVVGVRSKGGALAYMRAADAGPEDTP